MSGLVRFDLENLGTEIWLVSNPEETQAAFEAATECSGESPLDAAARVSKECTVLRAHWGNDIPDEPDSEWLNQLAGSSSEPGEVRELVESWWTK